MSKKLLIFPTVRRRPHISRRQCKLWQLFLVILQWNPFQLFWVWSSFSKLWNRELRRVKKLTWIRWCRKPQSSKSCSSSSSKHHEAHHCRDNHLPPGVLTSNYWVFQQVVEWVTGLWKKTPKSNGVWKSLKKYHSTLRAKRAMFTFWVDKSW